MLDMKFVRENIEAVQANLDNRHTKGDLDTFVKLYDERKEIILEVEDPEVTTEIVTAEVTPVLDEEHSHTFREMKKSEDLAE